MEVQILSTDECISVRRASVYCDGRLHYCEPQSLSAKPKRCGQHRVRAALTVSISETKSTDLVSFLSDFSPSKLNTQATLDNPGSINRPICTKVRV